MIISSGQLLDYVDQTTSCPSSSVSRGWEEDGEELIEENYSMPSFVSSPYPLCRLVAKLSSGPVMQYFTSSSFSFFQSSSVVCSSTQEQCNAVSVCWWSFEKLSLSLFLSHEGRSGRWSWWWRRVWKFYKCPSSFRVSLVGPPERWDLKTRPKDLFIIIIFAFHRKGYVFL